MQANPQKKIMNIFEVTLSRPFCSFSFLFEKYSVALIVGGTLDLQQNIASTSQKGFPMSLKKFNLIDTQSPSCFEEKEKKLVTGDYPPLYSSKH
jgi:hypothetical protein